MFKRGTGKWCSDCETDIDGELICNCKGPAECPAMYVMIGVAGLFLMCCCCIGFYKCKKERRVKSKRRVVTR